MIIGLGFLARVGKDSMASYIVEKYGYKQEVFADPIKENVGRDICGLNDEQLYGNLKEVLDNNWQLTPRQMFQLIGDALRSIHQDIFVVPVKRKLEEYIKNNTSVVVSDCRHLNEVKLIKQYGGVLIRIDKEHPDKIVGISNHITETELQNYDGWDYVIENNGTIEELYEKVDKIMKAVNNEAVS